MAIDYTPSFVNYTGQGKFRFWCQSVLPLVYDDSLSYMELLNKMVIYLNNTIQDVAAVETNVDALLAAYNQLQAYVNDYFDNLDVQDEINIKLDGLVEDGTMDKLLEPFVTAQIPGLVESGLPGVVEEQIPNVVAGQIDDVVAEQINDVVAKQIPEQVTDWLGDNVTPVGSAVIVDNSLTISGAAADAKVVGDALTNFAPTYSSSATYGVGDYALYNSVLYRCNTPISTAEAWTGAHWTAVKLGPDVSDLKNALEAVDDTIFTDTSISGIGYTNNSYWNVETSVASIATANTWRAMNPIYVKAGEIYEVIACQGATDRARIWIVTDDNFNIIAMDSNHNNSKQEKHESTFIIPTGGTKLLTTYLNNSKVENPRIAVNKKTYNAPIDHGIVSDLGITALTDCNAYGYYRSGTAYTASITDLPQDYDSAAFMLYCDTPAFASNDFCKQFLQSINGNSWVRVIKLSSGAWGVYQDWIKLPSPVDIVNPFKGKKLSLLGDSISALAGTIPEGNAAYYSGANHGITSASQMWWSVLCAQTGMTPCIINGWSGSGINWQTDSSHSAIVPMSDDSRCNGLHDGTVTPDVILIAGGVNDYAYAEAAQNEPLDWDGKSAPTYTEPTTGKRVYSSFTDAYAAMIKKIQTNYPNAIVIALSTWFTMRGTDNGYTLTHAVGQNVYTQQDYNDKIRYVAEQMHIPYIDVSNIGFNRNNFYPTYASDSSTIPTHPNAAGHKVMGLAIAEKLKELAYGFLT